MTDTNVAGYETFKTLKNQGYSARQKIWDRMQEAEAAGDTSLAARLNTQRSDLGVKLVGIRNAEIIYLTSLAPNPGASPVSRLRTTIGQAKEDLEDLEDLAKALGAATAILSIFSSFLRIAG